MATVSPSRPSRDQIESALAGTYSGLAVLPQQGGQGTIYKATAKDGTLVALKVYNADQVEERSEREVAALRKLKSDTIVRLHDAGGIDIAGDKYRFIATTFVDGTSLSDLIKVGAIDPRTAAQIAADIALALQELWSLRIVHRDVKPANIIVTPDGHAVLLDLGIARHLDQKTITTAGKTFGTVGYFAPEHVAARPVTAKADVFALGIVCQEMLTGRHPTHGQQKLLLAGGPKTASLKTGAPASLMQIIDRMVSRHPFDRPKPQQLAAQLNSFLKSSAKVK